MSDVGAGVVGLFSRVGPYPDAVRHGEDGFLMGSDPREWVETMERLILDPGLRRQVASAAWHRVRREFTVKQTATRWQAAITRALERRALRPQAPTPVQGVDTSPRTPVPRSPAGNPVVVPVSAFASSH